MRSGQSQLTAQQDEIVNPIMYSQINHISQSNDREPPYLSLDNAAVTT